MRLSDAMMMGSVLLGPCMAPSKDPEIGCAIQRALAAVGESYENRSKWWATALFKNWPWTINIVKYPGTNRAYLIGGQWPVIECIYTLNDIAEWSTEQIADWVRSIEPPEISETEQTNQTQGETIQYEVHA